MNAKYLNVVAIEMHKVSHNKLLNPLNKMIRIVLKFLINQS